MKSLVVFSLWLTVVFAAKKDYGLSESYAFMNTDDGTKHCINLDLNFFDGERDRSFFDRTTHISLRAKPPQPCSPIQQQSGAVAVASLFAVENLNRCPLTDRLLEAQEAKATALLFVVRAPLQLWHTFVAPPVNYTAEGIRIPMLFMTEENYRDLVSKNHDRPQPIPVTFTLPASTFLSSFDASLLLLALCATLCIVIGGYVSGQERHAMIVAHLARKRENPDAESEEQSSAPFGCWSVVVFVIALGTMLLLLYFLYSYFVWFLIVLFVIGASTGCHATITYFWDQIPGVHFFAPFSWADVWSRLCCRRCQSLYVQETAKIDLTHIPIYGCCAALAIGWCILRHEWYAYILQDIIAVLFCVHVIRVLRLPNAKWLTLLLSALVVYDVFFVFLTPYLTPNGCSIMVDVATGGACSRSRRNPAAQLRPDEWPAPPVPDKAEQLPILFKIPAMSDQMKPCFTSLDIPRPVMLGFGDVIVPGLLVAYCFSFDLAWRSRPYYFVVCSIGYVIGLLATFLGLALSQTAQPALIYLVPFTLIPVHVLALVRKQWRCFWRGEFPRYPDEDYAESSTRTESESSHEGFSNIATMS